VPLTIGRPSGSATVDGFVSFTVGSFASGFPNTQLAINYYPDTTAALAALKSRLVDVVITGRWLRGEALPGEASEYDGVYAWQANVGQPYPVSSDDVWVVTNNNAAVARKIGMYDNSSQVRADDYVNFVRSDVGVFLEAAGGLTPPPYAATAPVPDADVDLNGGVTLLDLGGIKNRWGAESAGCPGWIRSDVDNLLNKVSLGDVGSVGSHWSQDGLLYPGGDDPTLAWRKWTLGEYEYTSSDCTPGVQLVGTGAS
jgi:hypothetical protein